MQRTSKARDKKKNLKLKEERDNVVFVQNKRNSMWLLCRKWDKD